MASLSAAERLRIALDLADTGIDIKRQNLRRSYPHASPQEIEQLLRDWINRRPGAELGDCPGPSRPIPGA